MIQFDWPFAFFLLPVPLLVRYRRRNASASAIRIPPMLADSLATIGSSSRRSLSAINLLLWLAWICLLIAIAQPWTPGDALIQPVSGRAIAMAVDISGSMERKDFSLDGETLDRLTVVKQLANEFIQQRQGDRLSLVLYGKEAFIASPLTFDLSALGSILDSAGIGMAGRSTAIGDAIGLAIQTLQNDPSALKAIILLSDGTNNAGSVEPESAATLASTLGIRIHTIALGSDDSERSGYQMAQSADLDEETLQDIAKNANGEFFRAQSRQDLQSIYTRIDALERSEVDAPPVILRQDLRHWPQLALLVCLLSLCILQRERR